jgi:uncharacterized protein (TIGR00156 family)
MKQILRTGCLAALIAAPALVFAQTSGYTGPSNKAAAPAGYKGPTNVPLVTAKQLLDKGKDDQHVRVQGKLLNHKGGDDYEFADASGKMTVEIEPELFPQGAAVDQNTVVELIGEFDKETFGESTLDVQQIKVVSK